MKGLRKSKRIDEKTAQLPMDGQTPTKPEESGSRIRGVRDCTGINRDDYLYWTFNDVRPLERRDSVRDWLKSVGLQKDEDYLVDPDVQTVRMGLGWDRGADIDASAVLFDAHMRALDFVWYRQLRSKCGSVLHSGDNVTGIGSGDDEVISVELSEVPVNIHHLLFTVCVYSFSVSFKDVRSAYVRMMNGKMKYKHQEMFRYSLTEMSGHAMLMGVLTRKGAFWSFKALGTPATGRNVLELIQNGANLHCLSGIQSWLPEVRHIMVTVVKGQGLAAKDAPSLFRKTALSDPYFIIEFKKKSFKSEYKPQTLDPEWKSPPFEMGLITEAETKPLKIRIFDYDVIGADDFMGEVKIPGHVLYNLGLGGHTYWFLLGDSKKKEFKNEAVSGYILIHIVVHIPRFN